MQMSDRSCQKREEICGFFEELKDSRAKAAHACKKSVQDLKAKPHYDKGSYGNTEISG